MKLYSGILKVFSRWLIAKNNTPSVRRAGLFFYRFGLFIAVRILINRLPEIITIYRATEFDEKFLVGKSDIDLYLIADDMSLDNEVDYIKRLKMVSSFISKWFPFLYIENFFLADAKRWEEISRNFIAKSASKHWSGLSLVYGDDVRSFFSGNSGGSNFLGYDLRLYYEQILADIFRSAITEQNYHRDLYRYSLHIIRIFFLAVNHREALANDEYRCFLRQSGIDESFVAALFSLPEKGFQSNDDFLILCIISIIKIIEMIAEHELPKNSNTPIPSESDQSGELPIDPSLKSDINFFIDNLSKDGIKAIYLTRSAFDIDSYILYLVINNDIPRQKIQNQLHDIIRAAAGIGILKEKIRLEYRPYMYLSPPDVFPVIVTEKMIKFAKFLNGSFFFEAANFRANGWKIFGEDVLSADNSEDSEKFFFFSNLSSPRMEQTDFIFSRHGMVYRLLNQKNILCSVGLEKKYCEIFGTFGYDLSQSEERYKFIRRLILENYNHYYNSK